MKKTIAKIMAAAMLVASMPAMVLPTFTVDAASGNFSTAAVRFEGSYANNDGWYYGYKENTGYDMYAIGSADKATTLKLDKYYGMSNTATNTWNTNMVIYQDYSQNGSNIAFDSANKITNRTLSSGSNGLDCDYVDETGTVDSVATDNAGKIVIKFKANELNTYKSNLLKGTTAKTIKFYLFDRSEIQGSSTVAKVDFEIQVGETLISGKNTKVEHCSTVDESIQDATVEITKAGYAVLKSVSENDKKVNMKDKDIEVSNIIVSGIEYPIRKFDDKVLKKGTMKVITAKEIKHLGTGALRNCKKLRKVRMGSAKMRKIHSNAFYDCGKLKNIKINCKNLKAVGSKAFKALKKNCTISIKANKSKYNQVVKMIKKSGTDKVKFKRV